MNRRKHPIKKRRRVARKRKKPDPVICTSTKKEKSHFLLTACALQQELSKKYNFNQKKPKRIRKRTQLTLGQKMGITKPPSPRLQKEEWKSIKEKALQREDDHCSICLEEYDLRTQIILSCSHVFHSVCLRNFEEFAKKRICPICRKEQYQKTKLWEGKKKYIESTTILLQSIIRTTLIKKRFFQLTLERDPKKRMDHFLNQMSSLNERLSKRLRFDTMCVDKICDDVDRSMQKSRLLLFGTDDWAKVRERAAERDEKMCSICLGDLKKGTVIVTSCTHLFHLTCLKSFENYQNEPSDYSCPTCRSLYFRTEFHVS